MKMKKKILLLIIAIVAALTFALASCDSREIPKGEPTQKPTETPTEQSCAHAYDNSCDAECNLCGETRQVSHTAKVVEAVAPTCTQSGLTEGSVCSICNETIAAQQTVAAKGHTEVIDLSTPASCTQTGLAQGSHCDVCGETIVAQQEIEKTPHLGGGMLAAVKPTCTSTGLTRGETCLVCGETVVEQEIVEKIPHTKITIPAVPASCTATGLTEGEQCNVCKEILVEQTVIEALGHKYSEKYSNDANYHWVTCTNGSCRDVSGKEAHSMNHYNCTVCDYYNGPKYYTMGSGPAQYKPLRYTFDSLEVAYDQVAGSGMSISVESLSKASVPFGEGVLIRGWVGFASFEIESFGYWFNDDIHNIKTSEGFAVEAEQGVVDAAGQYAKRFAIRANTSGVDNITSISFVAVLSDGTYIILKKLDVEVTGNIEMGEIIPDDEIVKAEPETLVGNEKFAVSKLSSPANTYRSQSGLQYTAIGEGASYVNNKFVIKKSFTITFADNYEKFVTEFNKYKISYSSTSPLKAIVTYTDGDKLVTDTVFLGAGEQLFSCLTLGYIDGIYATGITSIEIQVLGNASSTTFVLYDIETEEVEVLTSTITYLANQRYELGIKLTWGGGISYIADKEDGNTEIRNLINCADAGRLVQQSYYGTSNPSEYDRGEFHGEEWGYNPVQGGNKYNEPSRIIDVQITGMSVYIKAQPRDWAHHHLTACYMENVYTVYSDRIQVDNRLTEYSGFKYNPVRAQELPAFYTIGYLNTFVNYGGKKPWTGAELSYDDDLKFWTADENATKKIEEGNTETWCAWINKNDDYGIGLYTPNVTSLFAGRNEYEESPDEVDASAQACSYVAAIGNFGLVNYETLEYSYLITTGSTQEIRDLFTEYKDFADNADLRDPKFLG